MLRSLLIAIVLIAVAGCAAAADAGRSALTALDEATFAALDAPPVQLVGRYQLTEVDGVPLPAPLAAGDEVRCEDGAIAFRAETTEGSLRIDEAGEIAVTVQEQLLCGDRDQPSIQSAASSQRAFFRSYDADSGELVVRLQGMRFATFIVEGGGRTLRMADGGMTWERGGSVPTPTASATWPPAACADHPALQDLPEIAAADTSGIGALVAHAYPGWRLSTEAEMGCRTIANEFGWGEPASFYGEPWGSGEAWWVRRVDFTGDGSDDVIAVLTNEADPLEDQLVILHADGTTHAVGHLRGTLDFGVTPAGATTGGCRYDQQTGALDYEEAILPSAAYWITNNDTWSSAYLWNGEAYVAAETVTGLGACH